MSCTEKQIKDCRKAGGQSTWNQSQQKCVCEGIKKDAQGKSIRRIKKGKPAEDAFGNPVYKTTGFTLAQTKKMTGN